MSTLYVWRLFRTIDSTYEIAISSTEPTVSPTDGTPIDQTKTVILSSSSQGFDTPGYVILNSQLSDSKAIQILASNTNGGIYVTAGIGGILVNTTNAIGLNAAAASNFTTSMGNLTLAATAGLTDIDGISGINIGNSSSTAPVNIATAANAQTVTIGNTTSSTTVALNTGTGGFDVNTASGGPISLNATGASSNFTLATTADSQNLTLALTGSTNSSIILDSYGTGLSALDFLSQGGINVSCATKYTIASSGTTSDAINTYSAGGYTVNAAGVIDFASANTTGSAITLDTSYGGGGITISSGAQGIAINTNGGLLALGNWSGGDIQIGLAAVARNITIGNTTSTTSLTLQAGTGGLFLGADTTSGKTIIIGNNLGSSILFLRRGTGGLVDHQEAEVDLADADTTLTAANISTGIITGSPTATRTLTLPTAASMVGSIYGLLVGDAFNFSVINTSSTAVYNLATNTGVTSIGNLTVNANASGNFKIRLTNVTSGSQSFSIYRV